MTWEKRGVGFFKGQFRASELPDVSRSERIRLRPAESWPVACL